MFPDTRLRRLRKNLNIRTLVQENQVDLNDLIQPLFICEGTAVRNSISSMPGQFQLSIDLACKEVSELSEAGIKTILLFGIPEAKDETGACACQTDGIIQKAIKAIKSSTPDMIIITDLCFCEYTSHGHCGVLNEAAIDNDQSLELLAKQAVSHAQAGADIIAPSGMLDGTVISIREALDQAGFPELPILGYSAKFASAFYGPFREAAECAPQFGDRRSYQMNPANLMEALREVELDVLEGVDMVMVKPGLPYLDVVRMVKDKFQLPTGAYHVSGEYAMIKAAAQNGWINEEQVVKESLLCFKRAGADFIITYFAKDYATKYSR